MLSRSSRSPSNPFADVWSGDYERAVAQLHNDTRAGAAVMRARVYGNLHLERRVLEEYAAGAGRTLDPIESANYRAIVACAMHAENDHAGARALFAIVDCDVAGSRDPLLALTIAYYRSIGEYAAGAQAESERIAEATLARLDDLHANALVPRESYRFEGNHLRARLLQSRSIARYVRDDYAGEERALVDALLCAELVCKRDVVHESNLLAGLAKILVRSPSQRAGQLVFVKARAMRFSAHIDHRRAAIKSGLAANRLIFGNSIDPETLGGRSAPLLPYRLSACIGTLVYGNWPDAESYRAAIEFAITVARASDWSAPADDEANRLLTFAALVAPHDSTIAQELVASFERAYRTYSRFLVSYRDPRRTMLETFARGCIAKAAGDLAYARTAFDVANAFWRGRGLLVAAAFGGIETFALSRDDADLAPARAFVSAYPKTEFSQRLRAGLAACAKVDMPLFPYFRNGCVSRAVPG